MVEFCVARPGHRCDLLRNIFLGTHSQAWIVFPTIPVRIAATALNLQILTATLRLAADCSGLQVTVNSAVLLVDNDLGFVFWLGRHRA